MGKRRYHDMVFCGKYVTYLQPLLHHKMQNGTTNIMPENEKCFFFFFALR